MVKMVTSNVWLQGEVITQLKIDGDTYFTGALNQGESENENILVTRDKITLKNIMLYSMENLHYRLWFYTKDDFAIDSLVGFIDFNLPTSGKSKAIGGTTYYTYNISDADMPIIDEDLSKELHIQLENRSVTAKSAGAGGKVQLMIFYGVNS